jgi:hypothetical protein
VADRGLRAVGDDHFAALDVMVSEDVLDRALDPLGRERLAVDLEAGTVRLGAPQQVARDVQRRFASLLRLADPAQLRGGFCAAPVLEQVAVDHDFDPVRAQVIGVGDRERRRHRRHGDPELAAGTQRELELDLPALLPSGVELVGAELLDRDDLELGSGLAHAGNLERMDDHRPPSVLLGVQEGVRDHHRHLMAKFRRTNRVAANQNVGHGADPIPTDIDSSLWTRHSGALNS